jgi:hypothetical protein
VEANRIAHNNALEQGWRLNRHNDVVPLETVGVEALCRRARTLLGARRHVTNKRAPFPSFRVFPVARFHSRTCSPTPLQAPPPERVTQATAAEKIMMMITESPLVLGSLKAVARDPG